MKRIIKNIVNLILAATLLSLPLSAFAIDGDVYAIDFENSELGDVSDNGDGIFDADSWGKCSEKKIVGDNKNKMFYYAKDSGERGQGTFSKSFDTAFSADLGYSVEFKLKSDSGKKKLFKLLNGDGGEIASLQFGTYENSVINETEKELANNADGNFHSYKFTVNSGKLSFFYDGAEIVNEISCQSASCDLEKIQFALQGGRTENHIYLDDLVVYSNENPVPAGVKIAYADNTLTLTAAEDCAIYYTTDLSYPDTSSNKYSNPIAVESETYIKAIAVNKNGVKSVCVFGGPYDYIAPPDPFDSEITPYLSDKMYLVDFEDKTAGTIPANVVFDADYGLCEERKFEKIDGNMTAKISKQLSSITTDAWLQHTFSESYSGNYTFEFSAKQTVERSKVLKLSTSGDSFYFTLEIGTADKVSVNGASASTPNNLDGNFHHYKLVFCENGDVYFYYDGEQIEGEFSVTPEKTLGRYRFSVGGTVTEGEINTLWLDNIMVYETENPIPQMPVFSKKSGETEYNTELSISAEEDCAIYYTLDGKAPKLTPEYRYTEPVKIDSDGLNVKAIAVRANGNYSATAVSGAYSLINENRIIRLTENPFSVTDASLVENVNITLFSLENNKKVKLVLALYKGNKLLKEGISFEEVTLKKGLNENLAVKINKNTQADKGVLYIWEENSSSFYPITQPWILRR